MMGRWLLVSVSAAAVLRAFGLQVQSDVDLSKRANWVPDFKADADWFENLHERNHKVRKAGARSEADFFEAEALNCPCRIEAKTDLCTCETVQETVHRLTRSYTEEYGHCLGHLTDWHPMVMPAMHALRAHGKQVDAPSKMAYQFGVYNGDTLERLVGYVNSSKFYGMDSFKGMPTDFTAAGPHGGKLHSVSWEAGQFNADPRQRLLAQFGEEHIGFVQGFYNESLTKSVIREKKMVAATYIDVDCDLYSSTMDSLDFMFTNNLIKPGTLIGYDDWWVLNCKGNKEQMQGSPLDLGEGLAHVELTKKHGVQFKCVAGPCAPTTYKAGGGMWLSDTEVEPDKCSPHRTWGPIFAVEKVGVPAGEENHGFELTKQQIHDFKRTSCPSKWQRGQFGG